VIINLTQHPATVSQRAAGVIDLYGSGLQQAKRLLSFDDLPTRAEIVDRAERLAALAMLFAVSEDPEGDPKDPVAMIGGAPFLMAALEAALVNIGIRPVYAFSTRDSVEETRADGSTQKTSVFNHAGFVNAVDTWRAK